MPVLGLYLAFWLVLPPGGFYFGDQGVKLLQVEALARSHTLAVGSVRDPASPFAPAFAGPYYAQVGGSFQAIYPIAYAAVVAPFYLLLGLPGVVVPSMIGALMAAYFGGRSAARLGIRLGGCVTLIIGLATPLPFYAEVLWEHALALGLLSLALYLTLTDRRYLAGLAIGAAYSIRPESLVFAPALVLAEGLIKGWKRALTSGTFLAAGVLTSVIPGLALTRLTTGSWSGAQVASVTSLPVQAQSSPFLFLARHSQLIYGYFAPIGIRKWLALIVVLAVSSLVFRILRRNPEVLTTGLYLAAAVIGTISVLITWVPAFSVIDAFPLSVAAFSTLTLRHDRRVRFLGGLMLFTAVPLLYLVPAAPKLAGGWGPRYFLPVCLPLALLAWFAFWHHRTRAARGALLCLLAYSVVVQGVGIYRLKVEQERWTNLNVELRQLQPATIATSVWWLPQVAAPTFDQVHWYGVATSSDLGQVEQSTDSLWWVWTTEPTSNFEPKAWQNTDELPLDGFLVVERRTLSTRGLHATLFRRADS